MTFEQSLGLNINLPVPSSLVFYISQATFITFYLPSAPWEKKCPLDQPLSNDFTCLIQVCIRKTAQVELACQHLWNICMRISIVWCFLFERMLNKIMNSLWQTFVCLLGLLHLIPSTEELLFPPKPTKLQINITLLPFLACMFLHLCTSHPMLQVQKCFFQVGETKDMTPKIITTQYITDLKEEDLFQYSSQNTKSSSELKNLNEIFLNNSQAEFRFTLVNLCYLQLN